ncbi:MAG TPA: methyltransferase domain-containing protein [Bacteroidia bacterium]|nr:methyltransferase domain-containing protein [Bacteroidia bacterium]
MVEWFKDWFNSPYYHILYKHRDDVEASAFINRLLEFLQPAPDVRFLDVACGKGRHSIYLNSKGYDVTGIDISPNSIKVASEYINTRLRFQVADMRKPFADTEYDYAVNLFTSFGYFDDRNDNLLSLQNIYSALKPGGIFVLDFFNAEKVVKMLPLKETKIIDDIEFRISKYLDDNRIVKTIEFTDEGHTFGFTEKVEAARKDDFVRLFNKTDFIIKHIFGNYKLGEFDGTNSDRLIFIAQKP